MKQKVTDEMISALVDGELDASLVRDVKSALLENPEQRKLYEELRGLNGLINKGLEELGSDEFALDLSSKLRARAELLQKENSKQSFRPYLNLAAALVVGVSAGALTSYKVGIDEREALGLKVALLEKRLGDKSVRYNLDQAMGAVSSKDDERNQLIEKIEESLPLQNGADQLLGERLVFSIKIEALKKGLEASKRDIKIDDKPSLADQRRSFDRAIELLEEVDITLLDQVLPLLREAYEGGHSGAGFVLLELVPPAEAIEIYRVLLGRLTQ